MTCRLLSNGFKFNVDYNNELYYKPCCVFSGPAQPAAATSQQHTQYRTWLSSIDPGKYEGCSACQYHEDSSVRTSWREASMFFVPDNALPGDSSYLEIQIDKTCNGGCIICGPDNSSFLEQELFKNVIPIIDHKRTQEKHLSEILSLIDISKVRTMNFVGGEPFLNKLDIALFKLLPDPSLVHVRYTTNGSIYPSQDRIEYWKSLDRVIVNFSIDGVGEKFDYIRYPLKWQRVEENIMRMQEHMPENVFFKVNHTVNLLNLLHYDEFEDWVNTKFLTGGRIYRTNTFSPAYGILSPREVPEALALAVLSKYGEQSKPYQAITGVASVQAAVEYLESVDLRRGLDWRAIFPEVSAVIN